MLRQGADSRPAAQVGTATAITHGSSDRLAGWGWTGGLAGWAAPSAGWARSGSRASRPRQVSGGYDMIWLTSVFLGSVAWSGRVAS